MYNPNYGYSPASSHQQSTSMHFSSTPTNLRSQRPRFGYLGPAAYPRPRSSASKPNPEGNPESARGQYGNPEGYMDNTKNKNFASNYGSSYQGEYPKSDNYDASPSRDGYRNVESYLDTPGRSSYGNSDVYGDNMRGTTDSMVNNFGNSNNCNMDISLPSLNDSFYSDKNSSAYSLNDTAYYTCNESFYGSPKKPLLPGNSPASSLLYSPSKFPLKNSGYNMDNRPDFQGRFQNKKDKFKATSSLAKKPKSFYDNKRGPGKKAMASKTEWRCAVCSLDFTSNIPYEMHLRGAKHAKKLKLKDAVNLIQSQASQSKEIAPVGTSFRCELCNVTANSSLQLQTHLDGTKHKNKLLQQQQPKEQKGEKESEAKRKPEPEVNGKSNGAAVVRPLPSEFGEPQQAKMCKFSCDICNITVNSEIQLQQHKTSKRHQAKVEGKPFQKKKLKSKQDGGENEVKAEQKTDDTAMDTSAATDKTTQETAASGISETSTTGEARKMVVGLKTLSASFVQGDTLH